MNTDNLNPIFSGLFETLGNSLNPVPEKVEPEIVKITVRGWRNSDKFPCTKCGKKLSMPDYFCKDCNVKIKPVMNF